MTVILVKKGLALQMTKATIIVNMLDKVVCSVHVTAESRMYDPRECEGGQPVHTMDFTNTMIIIN